MKSYSNEALAARRSGQSVVAGAVAIGTGDDALRLWGGWGVLVLDDGAYLGLGDGLLISGFAGSLGGAEQGTDIVVSGVDPEVLAGLDLTWLRHKPVVVRELTFDGTGSILLAAVIFQRGRVDEAPTVDTPGDTSTITIKIEGAMRGSGNRSERMRADADQRLISPPDSFFSRVSYAGEKTIYAGGKPPERASAFLGNL